MGNPEPISPEQREKMKAGAEATRAIRSYLEALKLLKPKHGRPSSKTVDELKIDLLRLEAQAEELDDDPLKKLKMLPKLDASMVAIRERVAEDLARQRIDVLAEDFVKYAQAYGDSHGITYDHWRQVRVPEDVLARAGIER